MRLGVLKKMKSFRLKSNKKRNSEVFLKFVKSTLIRLGVVSGGHAFCFSGACFFVIRGVGKKTGSSLERPLELVL